ncbi:Uu.00g142070.m01.CDS01 [Anthostomella pinea]|uniref:Uu.00g142070.m01.CDS01 n=1 Tax=Anthostomella pinea TaxID=933095 RepID=A0AAI8YJ51_9PEZI|nr:Uu.00g142070.m01.CDS01 [Anthostomella pinea]
MDSIGPPDEVLREERFFDDTSSHYRERHRSKGGAPFPRIRHWFLKDAQEKWIAHFQACASNDAILSSIWLDSLSLENVAAASARGPTGMDIYNFQVSDRRNAFNAIYDDMCLEGWWPWPKKEQQ